MVEYPRLFLFFIITATILSKPVITNAIPLTIATTPGITIMSYRFFVWTSIWVEGGSSEYGRSIYAIRQYSVCVPKNVESVVNEHENSEVTRQEEYFSM